jgi:hypothetical protein
MTDDLDPTKIDIDPMLFGTVPDDPDIERVPDDYSGLQSAAQQHRWNRQVTLISMLNTCVVCDGPIETTEMRPNTGGSITKYKCQDCGEAWVHDDEQDVTSHR